MLKGRESLVRLIGRRRRFLRHRHSLLTPSPPQGLLIAPKEEKNELNTGNDNRSGGEGCSELVDCPVCAKKVPNEDINSHLDECLARGTKRKLSQCTLFQLNFCTRAKAKVSSIESDAGPSTDANAIEVASGMSKLDDFQNSDRDESKSSTVSPTLTTEGSEVFTGESSFCNGINRLENLDGLIKYKDDCKLISGANALQTVRLEGTVQHQISDDTIDSITDSPFSVSENRITKFVEPLDDDDDNSELLLDTFIVGRRFGDDTELTIGATILLSRDPENVKDPNAIKVLTGDTGCSKKLGFISRELAQYLSPLIDDFHLRFEGHITSIPKHPRAVVPIQIYSSSTMSFDEKDSSKFQVFNSLRRNALSAVEFSKTQPPVPAKYQHNLLIY